MAQRIYRNSKRYNSFSNLKKEIVMIWNSIESQIFENLVKSMPSRLLEVGIAKGGHTTY